MTIHGYNLGLEFIRAHEAADGLKTKSKADLMTQLHTHKERLHDLSKLINALTQRKTDGKADFRDNPEFMDLIDRIYEAHKDASTGESILPKNQYEWTYEKDLEATLQVLGDQTRIIAQDVNEVTMGITQEQQDMNELTEISSKTLDMMIRHIESLIHKQTQR